MPTVTRTLPVVDVSVGATAPAASGSGSITATLPVAGVGEAAAPAAVVTATGTATRAMLVAGAKAKAKSPLAIIDPDFLSALIRYWESDAALNAAGLGTIYFDVAPPGTPYPYAVVSQNASTSGGFSTLKLTWRDTYYRFGIYGSDMDQVVNLGASVERRLDRIVVAPLSMWNGQQTLFRQEGDTLAKIRPSGAGGIPFVWCRSYLYHCRISRTRV
jgi:hypothetical protein